MTNPTTHEVTFPLAWLRAMRLLVAKTNPRKYLNGVAITRGYLAATTGKYLGAMRDDRFKDLPEIIIPNEAIDPFLRAAKDYKDPDITARWTQSDVLKAKQGTLSLHDIQHTFVSVEGSYPDITYVLHRNRGAESEEQPPLRLVALPVPLVVSGAL